MPQHCRPLSPLPFEVPGEEHWTLPARTSVLSKMLLPWAVLDMDTLLGTLSPPSNGEILLGMTSFSSRSWGLVGTWLPGPSLSGMWLFRGTWGGRRRDNTQHGLGRDPGQRTGTVRQMGRLVLASHWLNHVIGQKSATASQQLCCQILTLNFSSRSVPNGERIV